MERKRMVLGIDENGLGPLMGPLVVTGTLMAREASAGTWFDGIADSKLFFNARNPAGFARMEEAVIALFYACKKRFPASPGDILGAFCRDEACLSGLHLCNCGIPERFAWADSARAQETCERFSLWAQDNGIEVLDIDSICTCPRAINHFIMRGETKLVLDLLSFCDIVKNVPCKRDLDVRGGRIGGFKFYAGYLRYFFPGYMPLIVQENGDASIYTMAKSGISFRMGFFTGVESRSFAAAVSSIVGKYIREVIMASIRTGLGIEECISGYHDPATRKALAKADLRRLPCECLFREK